MSWNIYEDIVPVSCEHCKYSYMLDPCFIQCRFGIEFDGTCPNWKPKEDDQKAKADAGKPKLTLVPQQIIYDIAKVREYGNKKYPEGGPDNWKQVEIVRYRDAAFRHLLLYLRDPEGVDEESGLPHLSHLACNVAFLCELERKN